MKAGWTLVLAGLLAVPAVTEADAQTGPYPNKPVQIITDSSAGSTPDVALRPAEATAFVHKQQQTWQPILDEIAKNQR
jgi:tripartite-type tricarboxylate transporter receptor subunit TctC